jgi:hypothetical protein
VRYILYTSGESGPCDIRKNSPLYIFTRGNYNLAAVKYNIQLFLNTMERLPLLLKEQSKLKILMGKILFATNAIIFI